MGDTICVICGSEVTEHEGLDLSTVRVETADGVKFDLPESGIACDRHSVIRGLLQALDRTNVEDFASKGLALQGKIFDDLPELAMTKEVPQHRKRPFWDKTRRRNR